MKESLITGFLKIFIKIQCSLLSIMEPPINKIDQSDYMKLKKYLYIILKIEGFNKTKCL